MKSRASRFFALLSTCFFAGMAGISICLVAEYRFFRQQAEELVQLRQYYQTCINVLKRHISAHEYKGDAVERQLTPESQGRFLVVNREPEYLKREALKFARSHNLEPCIRTLYEKPRAKQTTRKPQSKPAKLTVHKKSAPIKNTPRLPVLKSRPRKEKIKKRKSEQALTGACSLKSAQLKKEGFFAWPLERGTFWMSSPFGPRRNPNGSMGFHAGTDLAAVRGTPIKAAGRGIVAQATYHKGYGNMVLTVTPDTKIRYAHLHSIHVHAGQHVKQGDIIGTVGNTGNVRRKRGRDGSHLHLEIYIADGHKSFKRVDPLYFLT